MDILDLIYTKRAGGSLSTDQLAFFIDAVVQKSAAKEQVAALLMAIYIQGMSDQEIRDLTLLMAQSGEYVEMGSFSKYIVDKHSTGGVGDKVTLILVPLLRALDLGIAKMSGRGLGHTGGTLDKLEVFPGFKHDLSRTEFFDQVNVHGMALAGQTPQFVPADKILYELRDITGTVESLPLIASSIMSKKIACGANAILLDIKVGSGATLSDLDGARKLARLMISIGRNLGRKTEAILTRMNQPLGRAVGNALEVKEAIRTLKGNGPPDLTKLCVTLGSKLLQMARPELTPEAAMAETRQCLTDGTALTQFRKLVALQGGNFDAWTEQNHDARLHSQTVHATTSGYVAKLDALTVGQASMLAGAGRRTKQDVIDFDAGIELHVKIGDSISSGDPIFTVFSHDPIKLKAAVDHVQTSHRIEADSIPVQDIVIESIDA